MIMQDVKNMDCKRGNYDLIGGMMGVIGALGLILIAHSCSREPMPAVMKSHGVPIPIKQMELTEYFRKNGSKSPEEMAYAVLQTRNPRLLSAIAVRESAGNPHSRRSGHKNAHDGAFQINSRLHGAVSNNAAEQALQAELVLEKHVKLAKGNIIKGLNGYGGSKTNRYSNIILAELTEVPK